MTSAESPAGGRRAVAAAAALAAVTLVTFALRRHGAPGSWGSDALFYVERILGDHPSSHHPRAERAPFLEIVRSAMAWGSDPIRAASLPGAIASSLVVPAMWLALRHRVGPWWALVPGTVWACLPADIRECVHPGADALTALPTALALAALCAAVRDRSRQFAWIAVAACAGGLGLVVKESSAFGVAAVAAAVCCLGRGRMRLAHGAVFVGCVAACAAIGFALTPGRAAHAAVHMQTEAGPASSIAFGEPDFASRVLRAVPNLLLTDRFGFGLLFVVALPLLFRLPFRLLRGDVVAVAALAGLAAFDVMPVSASRWLVISACPRFLLCVLPLVLCALVETLADVPSSRFERAAGVAGVVVAALVAPHDALFGTLAVGGAAVCAWSSIRSHEGAATDARPAATCAAAVLVLATALRSAGHAGEIAAVAAGAAGAWLLVRAVVGGLPGRPLAAVVVAAAAAAWTSTWLAWPPSDDWRVWALLPPGRPVVVGDPHLWRCLRISAHVAGGDAGLLALAQPGDPPPVPAPDEVIVLPRPGSGDGSAATMQTIATVGQYRVRSAGE